MNTEELIKQLKQSDLYAECPNGEEFKLSQAILFDGTKPLPPEALEIQKAMDDELKKREKEATVNLSSRTKATNIGQQLEKILPTLKNFKWLFPDCRFIAKPIDFVAFEGLSINKIKTIDFVEVKSGKSPLNKHQKAIRDALEDKKVVYKEFI